MSELHAVKKGRKPRKKIFPVRASEAHADVFLDEAGEQIDSQHLG